MSASETEWEFPLAEDSEAVRAPRRDDRRLDDPEFRAELFCYEHSGYVELRSAAGYLNSDTFVDLDECQ